MFVLGDVKIGNTKMSKTILCFTISPRGSSKMNAQKFVHVNSFLRSFIFSQFVPSNCVFQVTIE